MNNERLDILAQEKMFSNVLNFGSIDNNSPVDQLKLDRFCIDILPRIRDNVKYFILEPVLIEHILLAADYPNLTNLKLLHFKKEDVLYYLTNQSPLRYIFQEQITDLILVNDDTCNTTESKINYARNVYAHILNFFKRLKHLTIIEKFNPYPCLTLYDFPSTTFSSSILTHLSIDVYTLDDCLYLLDGRLKQLNTLMIRIGSINNSSLISHNMDNLSNLKYFSLKSYSQFSSYDETILPLLRRMSCLEKLTLYLRTEDRHTFIDGTHLQEQILIHMPHLISFVFYVSTYINTVDLVHHLSSEDIQRTFTNVRQENVTNTVHYIDSKGMICSIFSIPFIFDRLEDLGNIFPNIIFSFVTYLLVQDVIPFNHEFFIRVAQAFPLLKKLRIFNIQSQSLSNLENNQSFEIAQYPYLIYLDLLCADIDYIEQFLNEKKTYVPLLEKLRVVYNSLRVVSNNFTKEETRRNCAKVKRLLLITPLVCPKDFYLYFPSL